MQALGLSAVGHLQTQCSAMGSWACDIVSPVGCSEVGLLPFLGSRVITLLPVS